MFKNLKNHRESRKNIQKKIKNIPKFFACQTIKHTFAPRKKNRYIIHFLYTNKQTRLFTINSVSHNFSELITPHLIMNRILRILPICLLTVSLFATSCKHTSLADMDAVFTKRMLVKATYETEWNYPIEGGIDWKNDPDWEDTFHFPYELLTPSLPDGLRVQLYLQDNKASIFNIDSQGGEIPFTNGCQSLLFYNNNTEFIVFDGLQSLKLASATTGTRSEAGHQAGVDIEDLLGNIKNSPDLLFSQYIESFVGREHPDTETLSVTLRPLVFSYLIQFEFIKGLERIERAAGSLTGMAESVSMTNFQTSKETARLLFQCTPRSFAVQALIKSFGLPNYPGPTTSGPIPVAANSTQSNQLELEIELFNGTKQCFHFDVTDQLARQPYGGVIRITGIEIDEKKATSTPNSGFDAHVTEWGDTEEIIFPL